MGCCSTPHRRHSRVVVVNGEMSYFLVPQGELGTRSTRFSPVTFSQLCTPFIRSTTSLVVMGAEACPGCRLWATPSKENAVLRWAAHQVTPPPTSIGIETRHPSSKLKPSPSTYARCPKEVWRALHMRETM